MNLIFGYKNSCRLQGSNSPHICLRDEFLVVVEFASMDFDTFLSDLDLLP